MDGIDFQGIVDQGYTVVAIICIRVKNPCNKKNRICSPKFIKEK